MKHGQDYMPLDSGEAPEDHTSSGTKPEGTAGAVGSRLGSQKPRSWGACHTWGILGLLATIERRVIVLFGLGLAVFSPVGDTHLKTATLKPGNAAGKPGISTSSSSYNGGNGADLPPQFRYPTDFLRDVVPIPCHSHNDYWRKEPLFSALRAGCVSVEADVWWLSFPSSKNDLYVGHDPAALTPHRTFASLYVDPLVKLLDRMNPQAAPFYHENSDHSNSDSRRGVFDADPEQTLVLLVDVKTDGAQTWPRVLEQLEPLRARGWLTRFEDGGDGEDGVRVGPVTVVGTGNTPFDVLTRNATYRDAFFDAPLGALSEVEGGDYDRTNSLYASTSFKEAVGPLSRGELSDDQLRTIRVQIRNAHSSGLKARYWETPSWPIALRNKIWRILVEEGADILNVDDLYAASQSDW
ncbi:hypothetical protein SLS62_010928 [Diatrype stigma]|uniref:Altered inheritance of mitochondria protein 6 n=1 Tax=Diatrype stigma TaxID=117547 RepID=A0AAN9YGZ0_9PEZI